MEFQGNFGKCEFKDCRDGMEGIPNDHYHLALIDPPWGVKIDGNKKRGISKKGFPNQRHDERINYPDEFDHDFNLQWFQELQRISKVQILCVGRQKEYYWIREFNPLGTLIIIIKNPYGSSKISKFNSYSPYLVFGDLKKENKFKRNVMYLVINCGFLNNREKHKYIHPNPKTYDLWKDIVLEFFKGNFKGKRIIDIFGGTCTLGEVGESLGIEWKTFEINKAYLPDVEYRVTRGIRRFEYCYKRKKKETTNSSLEDFT
jgi:site-specific DNA-methyltransferase (adenine-specific)